MPLSARVGDLEFAPNDAAIITEAPDVDRGGGCALASASARADVLHATYRVSLIGLPIGAANLNAELSPKSYSIQADAKLTGLARLFANAQGASAGAGEIVAGRVSPSTFATIAASSNMTRTIRMALQGNAVKGVDIAPPFEDKPDRIPLGPRDEQNVVDPIGAFIFPAPASGPILSPDVCNRKIPIFDGYTRFDIDLTYVGERSVKAKGYEGPVVVCAFRYVPISGHQPRPGRRPNSWPTTRTSKSGWRRSRATAC